MSSEALTEIKGKLVGKWKVDRSECFEDFLREVGVNFFIRKMASLAKPVSDITVDDEGKITITMNAGFMTKQDSFKLGEEFSTDWQGTKCKVMATFADGKLVLDSTPEDNSLKPQKTTREIVGEELLMVMTVGEVVCKRYFKKLQE